MWPNSIPGTGRPKSFLLGLLIAEGYRRVRRNDPVAISAEVKRMVKDHQNLKVFIQFTHVYYDNLYIAFTGLVMELSMVVSTFKSSLLVSLILLTLLTMFTSLEYITIDLTT